MPNSDSATIHLPGQFDGHTMAWMLHNLIAQYPAGMPDNVTINFSTLSFIRATGVVHLSNFVHWMVKCGSMVYFSGLDRYSEPIRYLDDSQFFMQHMGHVQRSGASVRSTTRPLMKIDNSYVHSWLDFQLVPWLQQCTGFSRASLSDYRTCISELFNNIKDHTEDPIGSIFVQHYPRENLVWIAVADWGVGMPTTVRRSEANLTDNDAIIRAVQEGFSSRSQPNNRGAGLPLLLDKVVGQNGGAVTIFSQRGAVAFESYEGRIRALPFSRTGYSPGTAIEIKIRTDHIEQVADETEEMSWD